MRLTAFIPQQLRLRVRPNRVTSQVATPQRLRAKLAVLSLFPLFVLTLSAVWYSAERVQPELIDPDYHSRLKLAQNATREQPQRPLGLVLGSSRMVWGFQPEQLTERDGLQWFNGAQIAGGPTLTRLLLHRYLRDGVRPEVVAIEVMPPFFVKENNRYLCGHFAFGELAFMRKYSHKPLHYDYHFARDRFARASHISHITEPPSGELPLFPRGGLQSVEEDVSPAEREKRLAIAHKNNAEYLSKLTVRPGADRAFRDTIRDAQTHAIRVVLLRSPEGPTFRSWYNPDAREKFDAYIANVAHEFGVPILDARLWLDEDDFYDSHHTLKRGTAKFTSRFGREMPGVLATSR
jgi:hypothetical protein